MTEVLNSGDPRSVFKAAAKKHAEMRRNENAIARRIGNLSGDERAAAERELQAAKDARAAYLNELIADKVETWNSAGVSATFSLDVEGLLIDIGPDGTEGIHSHLPYRLISESAAESLVGEKQLLVTGFFEGVKVRRGGVDDHALDMAIMRDIYVYDYVKLELLSRIAAGDRDEVVKKWDSLLAAHCHQSIVDTYSSAKYKEPREDPRDEIADSFGDNPERIYGAQWLGRVSPEAIAHFLRRSSGTGARYWDTTRCVARLAEVAEVLSARGSWDELRAYSEWQGLRVSHAGARHSRRVFESRRSQVRSPHMYETIKLLGVLFKEFDAAALEDAGVRVVRSSFLTGKDKRVDCIGVWSRHGFNRIFISPDDHVRDDGIPENRYAEIPEISRTAFQGLEGLMAAFQAFNDAVTESRISLGRGAPEKIIRNAQEILFLIVSEVDVSVYTYAELATRELIAHVRTGTPMRDEVLVSYIAALKNVAEWYANKLMTRDPKTMLDEVLTFDPKHIFDVPFDASFYGSMQQDAPNLASRAKRYDAAGMSIQRVFVTPKEGLPYARELQAIAQLKLEKRPFIRAAWGAASYAEDATQAAASEQYLDALFRQAVKHRANVLVPGTQIELTMRLRKRYDEYLAGFPEGAAREKAKLDGPRFFCIEPGQSTWVPGNPFFDDSDSNAFPGAPFDMVLSPYRAGWADNGTASEYYRHICFQEAIIRRISDGQKTMSITMNGGGWACPENRASSFDSAELLFAREMGRHSMLMTRLIETGALSELKRETAPERFATALSRFADSHADLAADAGVRSILGNEHYRRELMELIQTVEPDDIRAVDAATFEAELERNLAAQAAYIAQTETPDE